MGREFKLPDLGEGVHEGQIIKLLVKAGDPVVEDQPLMEVETDKAAVEIPSPHTGTVATWHVEEGQVVNVGDVMVTFGGAGEDAVAPAEKATAAATASAPAAASRSAPSTTPSGPPPRHKPASPAVRKLARTLGVDLDQVDGSGPNGRVTRADVEAANSGRGTTARAEPKSAPTISTLSVAPPPAPAPVVGREPEGTDDQDAWGPIRRAPVSRARATIAANMTASWTTIPHVTDSDDADVTELESIRKGFPSPENGERKLTMLAFVVRAVARALRLHPEFNAHFDADAGEIVYKRYVGIGVGVHTERGLVAPVIRNADQLGVMQIADALDEIVAKARTASFAVNDTRGATYTISNAGAFGGSRYSTPIVAQGQCAVLAIGRSKLLPRVVKGEITPRLIMPLSHSFDHRLADGGQEIAFMRTVIDALENPGRLMF